EETRARLAAVLPREASTANPVDLLGSAVGATYEQAIPILLDDPGIDALLVLFVLTIVADTSDGPDAIAPAGAGAEKPVVPVVLSAEGAPRGSFAYPESAARALGLAAGRTAWLRRPEGNVPVPDGIDRADARAVVGELLARSTDVWLDPAQTRR